MHWIPALQKVQAVKTVLKIGGGLVLVLVVIGLLVASQAGSLIRKGVEDYAPGILGAPVSLGDVDISLTRGVAKLQNLVIGNPQGFKSDQALKLAVAKVSLDLKSLMSDEIVIRDITIINPEITYEVKAKGSNLAALGANAQAAAGVSASAPEGESAGKAFVIENLLIKGGKVKPALGVLGGKGATVPLPDIRKQNIGRKGQGATAADAMKLVLDAVTKAVTKVASGDTGKALLKEGGNKVKGAREKISKKLNRFLKK